MELGQIEALAAALRKDFYADAGLVHDGLERGRAFNLIHYESAHKFDVFPAASEYQRNELRRCTEVEAAPLGTVTVRFPVISAEDVVLSKLSWFKQGGCVSEQQWRDVVGVLRVQAVRLDLAYLREWAPKLAASDLFDEALGEASGTT